MLRTLKITFVFLFSFLGFAFAFAQNLVPDSSFSATNSLCKNPNWKKLTNTGWCTNIDSISGYFQPNWQLVRSTGHIDFLSYQPLNCTTSCCLVPDYSDVIYCKLTVPMVRDSVYEIALWVLGPDLLSVNSLQAYLLSSESFDSTYIRRHGKRLDLFAADSCELINPPLTDPKGKVKRDPAGVLMLRDKWIRVSTKYKAAGGERFFYLANLARAGCNYKSYEIRKDKFTPSKTNLACVNAYTFYIDDISIRLSDN